MVSQFSIPALWNLCSKSVGSWDFEILVGKSGFGSPSLITVRIEFLFAFQLWYCEFVWNRWGGVRKHYFVNSSFVGGGDVLKLSVGKEWWGVAKLLFKGSWNYIFRLSLRLKSRSARGASRNPTFMVLVLIKGKRRGSEGIWELPLTPTPSEVAFFSACGVFVDDWTNGGLFLFFCRLMVHWVMGVEFENTCINSEKWNISRVISRLYGWMHKKY